MRNDTKMKLVPGSAGYVLEDVPHLTDYLPDLPVLFLLLLLLCVFGTDPIMLDQER